MSSKSDFTTWVISSSIVTIIISQSIPLKPIATIAFISSIIGMTYSRNYTSCRLNGSSHNFLQKYEKVIDPLQSMSKKIWELVVTM